ncbi:MAG: hypothetical protein V3R54_01145, partial [Thermodesulfovibrionia bacterium]
MVIVGETKKIFKILKQLIFRVPLSSGSEQEKNLQVDSENSMYLEKNRAWNQRVIGYGVPVKPQTGDRGPVINAIHEIISAAGGVEYSLQVLKQNSHVAQEEYLKLCEKLGNSPDTTYVSVPEVTFVYYDFSNLVVWTRTVYERCKCLL